MNQIGKWQHKTTGEVYEIKQASLKTKDLLMIFNKGSIIKDKTPFTLISNWNQFGFFEKIE